MAKKNFYSIMTSLIAAVFIIGATFVSFAAQAEDWIGTYRADSNNQGVLVSSEFFSDTLPNQGDYYPPDFTLTIGQDTISFSFTVENTVYSETFSCSYYGEYGKSYFSLDAANLNGGLNLFDDNVLSGGLNYYNASTDKQYWIELRQLSKDIEDRPLMHEVTVITRYLDQARPEQSNTYYVEHGAAFIANFDVLDGYDIYDTMLRRQLDFNVDIDTKTVHLEPVEKDYIIELDFDKMEHRVRLTTQYLDQSQADVTLTNWIRHGEHYNQLFSIAEGYSITNLDQLPQDFLLDHNIAMINNVTKNHDIVLQLEKLPQTHNVTLTTRYLDQVLPEQSNTYQIEHGATFTTEFNVLDGYDINNTMLRRQLEFDVDMDTKTVSLSPVEKDYHIVLEFDKTEHRVKLTTQYLDQTQADVTQTDWVRDGESYSQTFTIADGYQIANLDQLPPEIEVNQSDRKVTISNVNQSHDIILQFEKKLYNVVIRIIYDDQAYDDQINTYEVLSGDSFDTDLTIEQGYAIKKVSFTAAGVSVNKSRQTVSINKVTNSIEVTITVR